VILCAEKGESMPTLQEMKLCIKELEKKIEEAEKKEIGPDWMEYLRERLPGFERRISDGFRCHGASMTSYASPHFLILHGLWSDETLHLLKTIVEMLEAAKRGELEGWPND
jgi:hypothetical protein